MVLSVEVDMTMLMRELRKNFAQYLVKNEKINAIKAIRDVTDLSLVDSKTVLEYIMLPEPAKEVIKQVIAAFRDTKYQAYIPMKRD